jgi:hypothetical protein
MGDLIAFRTPRHRGREPPRGGTAQILFFTGVRYERVIDDGRPVVKPPSAPQQRGGRKGKKRGGG